jgi:predicted ATPase
VEVLLRMAAQRPVLFVVEDLHWADASTLELLGALLERIAAHRILVLLTARPEFEPPWPRRPQLNALAIDRLPTAHAALLAERAAGLSTLNAEVIQRLAAQTDGIPLFVEEMTRMLVDSLGEPKHAARADGALLPEAIPATLNELLLARLDRLTDGGKQVVQLGAVLGRSFGYSLIHSVWTLDEAQLRRALASVAEAGVLLSRDEPPHSSYQFKHSLIQEAAYHSLPKKRRREHHLRVAQVLAGEFPELAGTQPELLAHHYGEAGADREALAYGERAGRMAVERSAAVEAIGHFGGALKRLANLPEDAERNQKELALQLALGAPLMAAKGYGAPEVEKAYARARELCRVASGDAQLFPAVQGLWQYYLVRGELPTARELAEQLLGLARASGEPALQLLAQRSLATTVFLLGEIERCRQLTETGLALYDRQQHRTLAFRYGQDPGVAHGLYLAWALWLLGHPDQSLKTVLAALELALETSHALSIAFARCFVGLLQNCRGEHVAAGEQAEAASAIAAAHQLTLWLASATMMDGWARSGLGQHEQGIARLQRGVAGWRETGGRAGLTFFLVTLAEAHCKAGQLAEAESVLAQVEAVRVANGEHYYAEELHRIRGEIAVRRDPPDPLRAEAEFREAVEVARSQSARSLELRAATSLAELLERQGKRDEAREQLQPVYAWFSEGFGTADLVRARALLDRLG